MSQDKKEYFSGWSSKYWWVIKSTAVFKTAADWEEEDGYTFQCKCDNFWTLKGRGKMKEKSE